MTIVIHLEKFLMKLKVIDLREQMDEVQQPEESMFFLT